MGLDTSTNWKMGAEPADAVAVLRRTRERLSCTATPKELETILADLEASLDQVLGEHAGMAEELISAYEQLGIVFDVTRQLPNVESEEEVLSLFVRCLRRTFAGRVVFAVRRTANGINPVVADDSILEEPVISWVACALEQRIVRVDKLSPITQCTRPLHGGASCLEDFAEAMIGPISCGQTADYAIVLLCRKGVGEFQRVDMLLVESLTTFCGDLLRSQRLVRELADLSVAMVRSLVSAVDQKDEYTCGHSLRVGYYATELGRRIGLHDRDLRMLQWSALLHDVGKIGIQDAVLKKAGKLTDVEFEHMKEHPVRSHHVVQGVPQLHDALEGILFHHERYDGSGYPEGRIAEEIPLQARIIQIADVFDALTSDRAYRRAHDWQMALSIMSEEAGRTIDPFLQLAFEQMLRERLEGNKQSWDSLTAEASQFSCGDTISSPQRGKCGVSTDTKAHPEANS